MTTTLSDRMYDRRWWTLAVLCLSLIVIGSTTPSSTWRCRRSCEGLGATGSQLQWIVDSYTLVFAGLLLTAGPLGDRFGRKGALTARPRPVRHGSPRSRRWRPRRRC